VRSQEDVDHGGFPSEAAAFVAICHHLRLVVSRRAFFLLLPYGLQFFFPSFVSIAVVAFTSGLSPGAKTLNLGRSCST